MENIVKKKILNNYLFKLSNYLNFFINKNSILTIEKEINIIKNELDILNSKNTNDFCININDDDLPKLNYSELQKKIYCNQWKKLSKEKKYDRIFHYLKKTNTESNYSNIINYYSIKKIKPCDIDYDEINGEITNIINIDKFIE